MGRTSVSHLPDAYTNMAEVVLRKDEAIYVPRLGCDLPPIPAPSELEEIITDEYNWLQHANILLTNNEELSQNDWISWAAYNASINEPPSGPNTPSLMLPLFRENANDSSTMYHSLCLTIKIIRHLNPRQTPILEADQPLYALCKKLQWKFPSSVGEDECLLMLGAMHTEKMVYTLLGDRARINSWIELELMINSIQFSMNWIGIELKDFELELNWNWKPQLIGIDQFIFNSIPHFTRLNFFCMPYYGNCSVTSNTM